MIKDAHDHFNYEVYDERPWELEKMIPLEVKEGALIILHGRLPHLTMPINPLNRVKLTLCIASVATAAFYHRIGWNA